MPRRLPAVLLTGLLALSPPAHAALHKSVTAFTPAATTQHALPVNAITHRAILQAKLRTANRPLLSKTEARQALLLVLLRLLAPAFKPVVRHLLPVTLP